MQQKIKEEEMRVLRGDQEIDEDQFDDQMIKNNFHQTQDMNKPGGSMMGRRADLKNNLANKYD